MVATPRRRPPGGAPRAGPARGGGFRYAGAMDDRSAPLAIVGGGNMAQALVKGATEAGVLDARRVAVAEPDGLKRDVFRSWGVRAVKTTPELVNWLIASETEPGQGQMLLAVKPQSLAEVGAQLAPNMGRPTGATRRVVVTILAGTPSARVRALLGETAAVVRAMPNTPARIRRGVTAVALGAGAEAGDEERAVALFSAVGRVVMIDESLMDAFTAVAGSGPAYVFYLVEAMTRGAIEVGFDAEMAPWLVRWVVSGAGAMLDALDQPAETLRAAVTSRGGTTAAATGVLDEARMMEAMARAIVAARDRGRELAGG